MLDAALPCATSAAMGKTRLAVVLFNLGGPDKPSAVRPFLVNLFRDPAILRVPFFVRPLLARIIAYARTKPATANYAILGGGSPLLGLTEQQGRALEAALPEFDVKCFVAMRYWHPFADKVAQAVKDWAPGEVVLLPLYPQYSTTTTGSSLTDWRERRGAGWAGSAGDDAVLLPCGPRIRRRRLPPGCAGRTTPRWRSWTAG